MLLYTKTEMIWISTTVDYYMFDRAALHTVQGLAPSLRLASDQALTAMYNRSDMQNYRMACLECIRNSS